MRAKHRKTNSVKYTKSNIAKRREIAREKLKQRVIRAGRKIMNEVGIADFNIRQVAGKVGYSTGTLYNVFKDFNEIILHVNAATLDEMKKYVEDKLDPKLKEEEAIKQLARLYIDFATKNHNSWGALFDYRLPLKQKLPYWYKEKIEELFSIIERVLTKFIKKKSEASRQAKLIWATVHGIGALGLTEKLDDIEAGSARIMIDSWLKIYFLGLRVWYKNLP